MLKVPLALPLLDPSKRREARRVAFDLYLYCSQKIRLEDTKNGPKEMDGGIAFILFNVCLFQFNYVQNHEWCFIVYHN